MESNNILFVEGERFDLNCDYCTHIAIHKLNDIIENLRDEFKCKECIEGLDPEDEPPCTSYCSVAQRRQQRSFESAGHAAWEATVYSHAENCRI